MSALAREEAHEVDALDAEPDDRHAQPSQIAAQFVRSRLAHVP